MYKALFYKEWIKLRWPLLILSGLSFCIFLKMLLDTNTAIEVKGAYEIWYYVIFKNFLVYGDTKLIFPISGLIISLAQFFPETRQKRLKLLFHLPLDHNHSLFFMLLTGFCAVTFLVLFNFILLVLLMSAFFPAEIVKSAIVTSSPWYAAGFVAYIGASLAIVEPAAWRKIIYAIAAYFMVSMFYSNIHDAYAHSIHKFIILSMFYIFSLLLPAFRFKRGLR